MIKYVVGGNLLESHAQTLVNTVNCVGVMGKGLALQFKQQYPAMYEHYRKVCAQGMLRPGMILPCRIDESRLVLNAATKDDWRNPSEIAWIIGILKRIVDHHERLGITSLAVPKLGCGNGGLDWPIVGPLMAGSLRSLPFDTHIYIGLDDIQF